MSGFGWLASFPIYITTTLHGHNTVYFNFLCRFYVIIQLLFNLQLLSSLKKLQQIRHPSVNLARVLFVHFSAFAGCYRGYSDTYLFCNSNMTHREIVGLVVAGSIRASFVWLISAYDDEALFESLHCSLERLLLIPPSESSFGLIFSCLVLHVYEDPEFSVFSWKSSWTPLVGFIGTGVFGCDAVQPREERRKVGSRDFMHTEATVLYFCSINNPSFLWRSKKFWTIIQLNSMFQTLQTGLNEPTNTCVNWNQRG